MADERVGIALLGIRYGLSLISIIYRISIWLSIISLIQENRIKLVLPIAATQLIMIGSSIFSIIVNYKNIGFYNVFLREAIYFIPNQSCQNIQSLAWNDLWSILTKIYCHFLEMIILMLFIIFNQDRQNSIDQIAQILNFFLLVFFTELFFKKKTLKKLSQKYLEQFLTQTLLQFCVRSLFLGQFLICHKSIYFFIFDLIIVLLFMGFSGIEELQQNAFKFGYKNDEPKDKLSNAFPENFILPPISFGIHFIQEAEQEEDESEIEKNNLFSGIQVIQFLMMMLFDQIFNDKEQNQQFRMILQIYFVISCYQFAKSIIWIVKFFISGPICRTIIIDCNNLNHINNNEINLQYFRFKPLQKIINVKFTTFNKYEFERVVSILIQSNKLFNIYMKCNNFEDSLVTLKSKNVVQLQFENIQFVRIIVKLIVEYKYYKLPFEIKIGEDVNQFNEMILLNEIVQNYQIIPNINETSEINQKINSFKQIVLQYIIFQKYIENELNFMPKQIFYDIFDE